MSDPLRTYNFLPWLRQGIGGRIGTIDPLGPNPGVAFERASVDIKFQINSEEVSNVVQLVGPGDILGINPRAIVKTEPRDWITNFEPNYLPHIEFYDEDFLWRYSPARATGDHKLRPWLVLVALTLDEFVDTGVVPPPEGRGGPLVRVVEITGDLAQIFPPSDQSWAWAHVHTSQDISNDGARTPTDTVDALEDLIRTNADLACSRLLCPRKLRPNTAYHAMLLPAFEIGRRAGLGEATKDVDALTPSWGDGQTQYPVYHRWYFRTSERGDFEYLVGLLEPKPVADEVGIRDMDMQTPGFGIRGLSDPPVVGLEGALRKPGAEPRPADWPPADTPPPDFLADLEEKVNLAAARLENPPGNESPDPVVTLPLYGRWHAMVDRLQSNQTGWVNELNADPRLRTPSGFGTRVIQTSQENYMKRAWEQVGRVIEANRKIRLTQMALSAGYQIFRKNLLPLSNDQILALTVPVHARVMGSPATIRQQVAESRLPQAALQPAFRSLTRPRGRIMKKALPDSDAKPTDLIVQLNEGRITAADPKTAPEGQIGLDDLTEGLVPKWVPGWLKAILRRLLLLWIILLVLLLLVFLLAGAGATLAGAAATLATVGVGLTSLARRVRTADALSEDGLTAEAAAGVPPRPGFTVTEPGTLPAPGPSAGADSPEARNFRSAAVALNKRLSIKVAAPPTPLPLDINIAVIKLSTAINPKLVLPKRIRSMLAVPQVYLPLKPSETIVEAMAHPSFSDPMYKALRDISSELLVPNLNKIPNNAISLMETNRRFIEAYMVGLNHEMGRELLWREYPTDQRGSYFRQFWDVGDTLTNKPDASAADQEESLRDITPLHKWLRSTDLGTHENRSLPTGAEAGAVRLVLVIRGELFKKYPTTVVLAQKAAWGTDEDTGRDIRVLDQTNPEKHLLGPMFKAEVEPDIHFFGFNLTAKEARGSTNPDEDPGWFFVLQERPGEPRFGMDVGDDTPPAAVKKWSELTWNHLGDPDAIHTINLNTVPNTDISAASPDRGVSWGGNSADMAYILYQDPVMVAFHAADMLE